MQPFFEWMQGLAFSAYFLESVWPTPIVQCIHLVSVAVFAGAVLVVDLRLIGRGLTASSIPTLARAVERAAAAAAAAPCPSGGRSGGRPPHGRRRGRGRTRADCG